MIALTWQTILLLAVAYFIGCIVGCFARKLKGAGPVVDRDDMVPAGAAVPREASPVPFVAPISAPPSARPASVQNAFRRADSDAPGATAEPVAPTPRPAPREVPAAPPASLQPPESVSAAVAEALAAPAPATAPVHDDLTRIRAIDSALEASLNRAGVSRYSEIAAWTSEQVKAISKTLGFSRRIERENWIEQAHILARGGETHYASKHAIAELMPLAPPPATSVPPEPIVVTSPDVAVRAAFAEPRREVPAPVPAPVAAAAAAGSNNLQRIGGISAEIEDTLIAHGVTRYSQIASWTSGDVERAERLLGGRARVSRENWIEQAQILANGGTTAYAREFDRHGGPPVAPIVPGVPPDLLGMVSVRSEAVRDATAIISSTDRGAPPPSTTAATAVELAPVTPPPASVPVDLSGMRSVRSAAYRGDDSLAPQVASGEPDDLKRIRGIGVLLERKLNAMGVTKYEQIANWTADDVGTVNTKLEFKGRIERENWIEQARILASGGHTDFSRRFERGEV